jgi:hypothetical protein
MWKDIVEDNCPKAMALMVKYCEQDVRLLERVFHKIERYGKPKSNAAVMDGTYRWGCQYCGSVDVIKSKTRSTAAGVIQHQMRCKDCTKYYQVSNTVYKEYRCKRFKVEANK